MKDWGLSSTNATSPAGGVAGFLDALGKERNVFRAPGESDDSYRQRVASLADVVSPNAIKRTVNRAIPGIAWCFREAGDPVTYPGFFFDRDFYDYDAVLPGPGSTQTGQFLPGEKVVQLNAATGQLATGRALVQYGIPAGRMYGIANVRGSFAAGTVTGQTSKAKIAMTGIQGGLRQANRYRVLFDYLRMRAYFYVGLPNADQGDFGFAYDTHPAGGYDGIDFLDFYDGFPVATWRRNLLVEAAVDKAKAGGVGFEILLGGRSLPLRVEPGFPL